MDPIRCYRCHKLLLKSAGLTGLVEVKCPKCGHLNHFKVDKNRKISYNGKLTRIERLDRQPQIQISES